MDKKQKRIRTVTWIAFAIYLVLLVWVIVFKTEPALVTLKMPPYRTPVNLIPFGAPMMQNGSVCWQEILENVLAFIPLGVFIAIIAKRRGLLKAVLWGLGLSLVFEAWQYVFGVGCADITDVLANTFGAFFGAVLWPLFRRIFGKRAEAVCSITLLCLELLFSGFWLFLTLANS